MRLSDWSSDVCSSDLLATAAVPPFTTGMKNGSVTSRAADVSRRWAKTSKGIVVTTSAVASAQVERTLVITAETSSALASREVTGLNKVMSPVPAGTPTAGHAVLTAVMPPAVMSPDRAQPAASRIRAIGASWLSFTGTRTFSTDDGRQFAWGEPGGTLHRQRDRKSTRLNSSQ